MIERKMKRVRCYYCGNTRGINEKADVWRCGKCMRSQEAVVIEPDEKPAVEPIITKKPTKKSVIETVIIKEPEEIEDVYIDPMKDESTELEDLDI